jgi:hypothetical protein
VKGDRVEVVVDVGDATRTYEIIATKAGRRVEVSIARGTVEVAEVTRTGQPVRSARFMATRVIAIVEYPVDVPGDVEVRARRPHPPENQGSFDL